MNMSDPIADMLTRNRRCTGIQNENCNRQYPSG